MQQAHSFGRNIQSDKAIVSLFSISPSFYFITNFLFYYQSDIFVTEIKIDKVIVNLFPLVFTSILSPFLFLAKDTQLDSTPITFSFFPFKNSQLDKFATIPLLTFYSTANQIYLLLKQKWMKQLSICSYQFLLLFYYFSHPLPKMHN